MSTPERYNYAEWHEGPDPLAPPIDLREALESLGREVMEGGSPRSALEELLRRGTADTPGLDELSRQLWARRTELARQNNLGGTLAQVKELLEHALEKERGALFQDPSDEARFAEAQLDALPSGTAAAVSELADYGWRSPGAAEDYQRIRDLLGEQLMSSRFEGMKEALEKTTGADQARVAEMLSDLNDLLAAHARGEDTSGQFQDFMASHGEFFPENPQNTDELIDSLAARSAAATRMMNSMSEQQRSELTQLMQQAFGSPELAGQVSALDANLRALRPGEDWDSSARMRGQHGLDMPEGVQAMMDLGELDALAEQLGQGYPGARLEDIDSDALARQLGDEAAVNARRLSELERELAGQGLFERAPDGSLRLSPKALRRLGQAALSEVLDGARGRSGQRETRSAGAAGELTGASRPWEFGDAEPWDVPRTLRNAVLRTAGEREPGPAVRLDVSDVEVSETEQRSRAAVALCVDTSWSMVSEGRWLPMKRTALALHQLVSTRFRGDALALIGFGRYAQSMDLAELIGLEGTWEQGTNLHHALLLAGRHLRRNADANPVVLAVTDGEPTAHLEPEGVAVFDYPPAPRTLALTVAEVDRLAKLGTDASIFRLGDDPRLTRFVDALARRAGGRVLAPDLDGLGAAVVSDYLRARKRAA
jgi:uncharacterized protein with von Willebrand factor type A (vWA) domain